MTTTITPPTQRFDIGYHLNSWDLTGQSNGAAVEFLAREGFGWYEILAGTSLSTEYVHKHMPRPLGGRLPVVRDADLITRYAELSAAQTGTDIKMKSLYHSGYLVEPAVFEEELKTCEFLARVISAYGGDTLVLGGGPRELATPHTADDYRGFARALEEVGRRTAEVGVATVLHPHLNNFIERHDQFQRLVDVMNTDLVGLCIDPAHLLLAGSDPVAVLEEFHSILRHFHLKDTTYDPEIQGHDRVKQFCELGQGDVELGALIDGLRRHDFDGVAIIELDISVKGAEISALESRDYLTSTYGLTLTGSSH